MKLPLRLQLIAAIMATFAASMAFAQNATFSSDTTALAASGGTITFTATTNYETTPGALGWSLALPADWTLVNVSGPHVPAIVPEAGTAGTLEFAYMSMPAQRAEFSIEVRYPANPSTAKAIPTVLVRSSGKLTTLTPAAIELRPVADHRVQRSHN